MTARIYVACLASYNNGVLHGKWLDLADFYDEDDLQEAIQQQVLITSRFPNVTVECPECEGMQHICTVKSGCDHADVRRRGIPEIRTYEDCERCMAVGEVASAEEFAIHDSIGIEVGEYTPLSEVMKRYKMLEEHGDAWVAFVYCFGEDVTEDNFSEAYVGAYESEADFAEQFSDEMGDIPENSRVAYWIDWQRAWDCDLRHSYSFHDGYVFRSDW
jgi:antirestriction protein